MHSISCNRFILRIYYNNDDVINIYDEVKMIKKFSDEHYLGNKGQNPVPAIQDFKTSQYKIFDNSIAIILSTK